MLVMGEVTLSTKHTFWQTLKEYMQCELIVLYNSSVTTTTLHMYCQLYTTQECTSKYNMHNCGQNHSFVREVYALHLHYTMNTVNIVYSTH